MTSESPSLLLQRAAELIERQAEHFADYLKSENHPGETGSPVTWWIYDTVDRMAPSRAKRWVETMNPAVAAPLVAWLRYAHAQYEVAERTVRRGPVDAVVSESDRAALDLARLVLGVSAEGQERSDHE